MISLSQISRKKRKKKKSLKKLRNHKNKKLKNLMFNQVFFKIFSNLKEKKNGSYLMENCPNKCCRLREILSKIY
jgi:hypothetical protein